MKKYVTLCCAAMLCAAMFTTGCSSNQTVKNAWKGTKGMWFTYVSPPASIDYDDKSSLNAQELLLTSSMIGIDVQLGQLERVMTNADKPPTSEWIATLFSRFPWLDGFAGVKADGAIIGQEPAAPLKPLDFAPLLEPDPKQNPRALRSYVQDTPMGPEVFLAAPLYDAENFLGIVVCYFDMRNLLGYSANANEVIILSPQAVLWSGKYTIEGTPLATQNWEELLRASSKGTLEEGGETFYWVARYLGNQPLIFASSASSKAEQALEDGHAEAVAPLPALSGVGAVTTQNVGPMEVVKEGSPEELEQPKPAQAEQPRQRPRPRQQVRRPQVDPAEAAAARKRDAIDVSPLGNDTERDVRPSPFGPPRDTTSATPQPADTDTTSATPQPAGKDATSAPEPEAPQTFVRPSPFGPKKTETPTPEKTE